MKIALPFENSNIFSSFEQASSFKIYEIENGKIVTMRFIPVSCGEVSVLSDMKIDILLCNDITSGVKAMLADIGIRICDGFSGNADVAVRDFLKNNG